MSGLELGALERKYSCLFGINPLDMKEFLVIFVSIKDNQNHGMY